MVKKSTMHVEGIKETGRAGRAEGSEIHTEGIEEKHGRDRHSREVG